MLAMDSCFCRGYFLSSTCDPKNPQGQGIWLHSTFQMLTFHRQVLWMAFVLLILDLSLCVSNSALAYVFIWTEWEESAADLNFRWLMVMALWTWLSALCHLCPGREAVVQIIKPFVWLWTALSYSGSPRFPYISLKVKESQPLDSRIFPGLLVNRMCGCWEPSCGFQA